MRGFDEQTIDGVQVMSDEPFPGSPDDMMNTIAALRARVALLEAALLVDGAKLLARNARLEAALQPFAEIFSPPMSLASEVAEARAVLKDESQ